MSIKPVKKGATYDDLRRVPDHYVAEMFDGDLISATTCWFPTSRAGVASGSLPCPMSLI